MLKKKCRGGEEEDTVDFLLIEVPARYAYPGVPVKRHMLNRCRSEAEKAFVRRLFHYKSYKRNAKRLQITSL